MLVFEREKAERAEKRDRRGVRTEGGVELLYVG